MTPQMPSKDEAAGGARFDRQEFAANGVWENPGRGVVRMMAIGGGAGGGSGRRGAAGTDRLGGHGGGGGGVTVKEYLAEDLPETINVVVGAGGAGGAAVTVDDTNGAQGFAGGNSMVSGYAFASGGKQGKGGEAFDTDPNTGNQTTSFIELPMPVKQVRTPATGGTSYATSQAGGGGHGPSLPGGGGGGGSIGSDDMIRPSGLGGRGDYDGRFIAGGAPANADGQVGNPGNAVPSGGVSTGGSGGGGGGASVLGAAGVGGAGGVYGGGGGGGGASVNGQDSGAGGSGAPGFVRITTIW